MKIRTRKGKKTGQQKGRGITFSKINPLPKSPKENNIILNSNRENGESPLPRYPPGIRPKVNIPNEVLIKYNPKYLAKRKILLNKIRKEKRETNKNSRDVELFIYPTNEYPVNKTGKMFMSYFPKNNTGFKT